MNTFSPHTPTPSLFSVMVRPLRKLSLEKSDSLGTKSRRKRLWDYLGGRRSNLVRNVTAGIGFNRTTDSNKIGYCIRRPKVKRIEKNSNDGSGCLFGRLYDIINIDAIADRTWRNA